MSNPLLLRDVLNELRANKNSPRLVRDWKQMIPEGSRWFPGSKGNPACKVCLGTGYVRLELENRPLPVGHKFFGKLFICDCVQHAMKNIPTTDAPKPDPEEVTGDPEEAEVF